MNLEDVFRLGAEAMRTEIAARLMMSGKLMQAQEVLAMKVPQFRLPEVENLKGPDHAR